MFGVVSPSAMCTDRLNLESEIKKLDELNIEYLHIDFMDNKFVPNIMFDTNMIKSLKNVMKNLKRDIHIMAYEPQKYFDAMEIGEGDLVSVHYEASNNIHAILTEIKKRGALPSLAISPDTPVSVVKEFLDEVHVILLMTVYPGFAGQPLAPNSMERITELKEIISKSKKNIKIEVDGHVSWDLCQDMRSRGGDIFVMGSSVYSKGLYLKDIVIKFRELVK